QVAVEALLRRGTERAVERASHLRRDAERAAILLGDEHHLEGLRGIGLQQPLARAIARVLDREDLRCANFRAREELRARTLRQIRYRLEAALAALVDPAHELTRAERFAAESLDE